MKPRALITGITGQDGSYMAELLLAKDYEVFGLVRRTSQINRANVAAFDHLVQWVEGDLLDQSSLNHAVAVSKPDEVYNFAAQSHVGTSFKESELTGQITGLGAVRVYEAVRTMMPADARARIYQASSSEMFGNNGRSLQEEEGPFEPVSPYGCAKLYAHRMASVYRWSYGMFISCGIGFNHESPRRGEDFVTRKITKAIGAILARRQSELVLGNIGAKRDWLHAKDVVEGAWALLQHPKPLDCIFASGVTRSVRDFAVMAFEAAGLNYHDWVRIDQGLMRPTELNTLEGCPARAALTLKWAPKITFNQLVEEMVTHDIDAQALNRRPVEAP